MSSPVPGTASDPWGPYIREASTRYDMPDRPWIRALMRQESGGQPLSAMKAADHVQRRRDGIDAGDARHLCRVAGAPDAYLGGDPFDPHDNIMAGVAYMREMYDMYGSPGFLAAYNAGPNRLDDYLANQRGLPDETRRYVASIGPSLRYAAAAQVHSPAEQFAMNQVPLNIPAGTVRYGYGSPCGCRRVQLASAANDLSATGVYGRRRRSRPIHRCRSHVWSLKPQLRTPPRSTRQAASRYRPPVATSRLPWHGRSRPARSIRLRLQAYQPRATDRRGPGSRRRSRRASASSAAPREVAEATRHTWRKSRRAVVPTRVAIAMHRTTPQRSGGSLHLDLQRCRGRGLLRPRHGPQERCDAGQLRDRRRPSTPVPIRPRR